MAEQEDFEALLNQMEKTQGASLKSDPKIGEKVRGKILSIGADNIFIDLGAKSEGSIEVRELANAEGELTVEVGDTVESTVTGRDEQTGTITLGSGHGQRVHGSAELQQAYQHHLPVEGLVTGATKGGVEVKIAGIRAFCPASQLDIHFIEEMEAFVGQHLSFQITEYQGGKHPNLVVSRRILLEEEQKALAEKTRTSLEIGAVMPGTVTSLQDYGAFVDLGGLEGMVHISELAFGRVNHPKDILSVGQQVEVAVLRIDKSDNPRHPEKIALSIRATAPDPWQDAATRYPVGTVIKGSVTRLQPFGAFVELVPGIEGLIHISELGSERRVTHPNEILNSGDSVEVKILSVDIEKHRIGLSLKTSGGEVRADPGEELDRYKASGKSFGTLGDLLKESMKKGH